MARKRQRVAPTAADGGLRVSATARAAAATAANTTTGGGAAAPTAGAAGHTARVPTNDAVTAAVPHG